MLEIFKIWISPVAELSLIIYIAWKFYTAGKLLRKDDFLIHCRLLLFSVLKNNKIANMLASEIAVFYYVFCKTPDIDYKTRFTTYKENGIILVLYTFLFLFMIETTGMHFVLQLWNKTFAWVLTALSFYTCIQLFAHIRALQARPVVISNDRILLCSGLMGGDAIIMMDNIAKIERTSKPFPGKEAVKLALIKGMEKHNIAIYLNEPVQVIKAFGISKTARVLLVAIDRHQDFASSVESHMQNNNGILISE